MYALFLVFIIDIDGELADNNTQQTRHGGNVMDRRLRIHLWLITTEAIRKAKRRTRGKGTRSKRWTTKPPSGVCTLCFVGLLMQAPPAF